jgi:hypothetical protein
LRKANPKDEATGRRRHKNFQWLTSNIGYPKLGEHLGAVTATMKLSNDWHDCKAKLKIIRVGASLLNSRSIMRKRKKTIADRAFKTKEAAN